jgi:hypothetical protein
MKNVTTRFVYGGAGTLLILALLVVALQVFTHTSATTGAAATATLSSPTATGTVSAISQDAAIDLARKVVTADSTFVSASFGRFADVYQNARLGPDPGQEDMIVWAVEFESAYTICPPDGSACWTPRPGFTTVILDGHNGDWVTTLSYSPH